MTSGPDFDTILRQGAWDEWRARRSNDPEALSLAARAWCSSALWDEHTPRLEDWKTMVADLTYHGAANRAPAAGRELPFPAIPLFEDEQIKDWCSALPEPSPAAELAECLDATESFLSIEPGQGAELCWEALPVEARRGLNFVAFRWLLGARSAVLQNLPLPSVQEVCALLAMGGARSADAVRRIEDAARQRRGHGMEAALAEGILEALAQWRNPQTAAVAVATSGSTLTNTERLCSDLFGGTLELSMWADANLAAITKFLREHDYPSSLDEVAWAKFREVLKSYPGMLDIDSNAPAGPLPVLDVAACIRSSKTIGEIALGLLPLAGARRQYVSWWKSLRAGLRPAPRRGGWCNANDRRNAAIHLLRVQSRRLPAGEAKALEAAFAEGVTHAVR